MRLVFLQLLQPVVMCTFKLIPSLNNLDQRACQRGCPSAGKHGLQGDAAIQAQFEQAGIEFHGAGVISLPVRVGDMSVGDAFRTVVDVSQDTPAKDE